MPDTRLFLIRHGETDWNRSRRWQGHTDIGLNAEGLRQAELLAERLAREHAAAPFAALYASDLSRARDTAAAIARHTGLALTLDAALRERHCGVMQGLTGEEVAARYPEAYRVWREGDMEAELQDGERGVDFSRRVLGVLRTLALRHPGLSVLVVLHGGVLDCVYRACLDPAAGASPRQVLPNASIHSVRYRDGLWMLDGQGDTAHLDRVALDEL